MIIDRWINPLNDYENPLDGILKQMQNLIGRDKNHYTYGCPLNNLVQEMSPVDRGFKQRLETALNLWISEMEKQLKRGQKAGFIRGDVNVKQVAIFVVMAHEGFYGMLKGINEPKLFDALFNNLNVYFKSISA